MKDFGEISEQRIEGIGRTSKRTRQRLVDRLRREGIGSEKVLELMLNTPRHLFISEGLEHKAYDNTPLPIGNDQTISQPYIVAMMTELLLGEREYLGKVLEIGTGCGYQSAILSKLAKQVYSIERIRELQFDARRLLTQLGYRNIKYMNGDGFQGWTTYQPYDGIIVTAAPSEIPQSLIKQLAIGGRLVIPVGNAEQTLRVVTRTRTGFRENTHVAVRFVPMLQGRA
ncbi:MAG: protein-L-isoaspartate(D-aspartate) O-methyltransferase [Gammaproteobacteria bacterium]|nr:protein-L-isoaspartate(D-aspartate) O-methyltransferase [Gammaproteobacteria bacterium]